MELEKETVMQNIQTTIGDLICAIKEAAEEARVNQEDLDQLTHFILMDLLRRSK